MLVQEAAYRAWKALVSNFAQDFGECMWGVLCGYGCGCGCIIIFLSLFRYSNIPEAFETSTDASAGESSMTCKKLLIRIELIILKSCCMALFSI